MYNPYQIVREFEGMIAQFAGADYGVAVESCSAAIFLCCEYLKVREVTMPCFSYPSVPMAVIHAGGKVKFCDRPWQGMYELEPYKIYDGALRFRRNMYEDGYLCLSFHAKKHLPIGRGGMILTNDGDAYKWLKRARFDGRDEVPLSEDTITQLGWNMYLTPEQAARGIALFNVIKDKDLPDLDSTKQDYPDLSMIPAFQ
jgi:dTDP-4-amino-4,6-dideoxygalactose transaminase